MTGRSQAKRDARASAHRAESAEQELREQKDIAKRKADREQQRAQRLLARSLRASAGGFFESDAGTTLGGSGSLG